MNTQQTPASRAKELGCTSLKEVVDTTNVPRSTLNDYFKSKRVIFDALCIYTRYKKELEIRKTDNTTK